MDKFSSLISSEADLKEHIASYPELYEDLAVDALEERLEMSCGIQFCDEFCLDCDLCEQLCLTDWCVDICIINSES